MEGQIIRGSRSELLVIVTILGVWNRCCPKQQAIKRSENVRARYHDTVMAMTALADCQDGVDMIDVDRAQISSDFGQYPTDQPTLDGGVQNS